MFRVKPFTTISSESISVPVFVILVYVLLRLPYDDAEKTPLSHKKIPSSRFKIPPDFFHCLFYPLFLRITVCYLLVV